jgi:ubiquinone/menaquinone biosynthesis C-methylase UbiE
MKLNLGSGTQYQDDFVNIDLTDDGDIKADVRDLKYDKESIDCILASHLIMYFTPEEFDAQLEKWHDWLKPGGELIIESGDLMKVCKHILEATDINEIDGNDGIKQLFGFDHSAGHKWAWCPRTVRKALEFAGFTYITDHDGKYHGKPHRDFLIIAIK